MYSIGDLARETETKITTIRYYEKQALLQSPGRSAGNHRVYSEAHLRRLRFIRRARELGFSQRDIQSLLGLGRDDAPKCREVNTLTRQHLHTVRRKIRDLQNIERTLLAMSRECEGGESRECPIISALQNSEGPV